MEGRGAFRLWGPGLNVVYQLVKARKKSKKP
jgi:hypothetical protein